MTTTKDLLAQKKILDKAYEEAKNASIRAINTHLRNHKEEVFTTNELAEIGEIPIRVMCGSYRQIRARRRDEKITKYYVETTAQGDIINSKIHRMTITQRVWFYD